MKHYRYNRSILAMDGNAISSIYNILEGRMRTGSIEYQPGVSITSQHLATIKEQWPQEFIDKVRDKALELSNGERPDGIVTYRAMRTVLLSELPALRRSNSATTVPSRHDERVILADLALSMGLGISPNISPDHIRNIGGKRVDTRVLVKSSRLVVNDSEIDNADVYVCAMANDDCNRVIILGWASRDDLRAANHGNKLTDPGNCTWSRPSFWMEIGKLRSMIDLMRQLGVTRSIPGFVMESVPAVADLPIPESKLDDMGEFNAEARDRYYSDLGLEDPAKASAPAPQSPKAGDNFEF